MDLSVRLWYLAVALVVGGNGVLAFAVWRAAEEPVAVAVVPPDSEPEHIAPPPAAGPTTVTPVARTTVPTPGVTSYIPPRPRTTSTPQPSPVTVPSKVAVTPSPPAPAKLAGDVLILVLDTKSLRTADVEDSWREQLRTATTEPAFRGRLLGGNIWLLAKSDRAPRPWAADMARDFTPEAAESFASEDVEGAFRRAHEAIRHLRGRATSQNLNVFLLWTSDKNPDACIKNPAAARLPAFDERSRLLWHGTEWNRETNRGDQLYTMFPRGVIRLGTKPAGLVEAMRNELR
jgi:hypothetical protein